MAKPITELTKDIRKFVEEGRAAAGPEIVESLQRKGPWWTGNFGRLWELDLKPIQPILFNDRDIDKPEDKPTSFLKLPRLQAKIGQTLYVGNMAWYAGYAVNKDPINDRTYGETRPPQQMTASSTDWYEVYTKNGGLLADLDKAFKATRLG
jgi:hypothetical protein